MKNLDLAPGARFLLVRTDKIGDLLLTTPALMSLRKAYPEAHIAFLCRKYASPILENNPALNQIILCDDPGATFAGLANKIRSERFDAAIHFYADARSLLLTALARVPERIGPLSKISSLLLSRRIRQNRSQVQKHEAEYNLDLVAACGAKDLIAKTALFLTEEEKSAAKNNFEKQKISGKPVLMHPGSAGSAKNWPIEKYLELAQRIAEKFGDVIFTTGPGEEWIGEKAGSLQNGNIHVLQGSIGLRGLAGVISQSRLMISNSTGPLHMAVALGTPTCSFYPLEPLMTSAKRWGPYGDPKTNIVLTPGGPNEDMSSISVDGAFEAATRLLNGGI